MSRWSRFLNVLRSGRLQDDLVLREQSRDLKLLPWLDSVWHDLRLGTRMLRKDAGVSAAAVISLGLAIGACTAAFSLIDALILRELPVRDPNRLVYVTRASDNKDLRFTALFSYPLLDRVRQVASPHMEVFSMSHQSRRQAILPDGGGVEEKLLAQFVSGNAFSALGVTATIGRVLEPSDDLTPGAHQVAVVSHAFWSNRLRADPDVLGSWIQIEQRPYQIVGVAQQGFSGAQPGVLTDVWLPNMMFNRESLQAPNWNWLQVWGRLAPGETPEAVQAIVQTAFANFEDDEFFPKDGRRAPGSRLEIRDAASGYSQVRQEFERPLLTLAAIIGLVLLIACSNVANLLLARGATRTREMALRASIGAGRTRLLQQILIESGVMTLAAALLGVLASRIAVPFMVGMLTTNENPVYLDARLDWRVLTFVATLGCLTTLLFGIVPALRASAVSPGAIIAVGDRSRTAKSGVAQSLVAAQVGFSLMILFVAALLMRSFDRLLAVDLGFKPAQVVLATVETRDRLEPANAREIARQLLDHVRLLPGVDSASLSGWAFFRGFSNGNNVGLPDGGRAQTFRLEVSSQFFQTLQTPVLDGREFNLTDSDASDPVPVIVNDVFARKYLHGERAVGQRLRTTRRGQPVTYQVVGVVADTRDGSVRGEMSPFLFTPIAHPSATIEIRSAADSRTVADRVRLELPQVHPSLRLVDVTLQTSLVANTLLRERLLAVLSGFFAALGLVLAAVGLYGVLSYAVVRRTREIGIRLALGAPAAAVVKAIAGRVTVAVIAGIAIGLTGGLYFARFVETLLFETQPMTMSNIALPVLGLLVVAVVATWAPLRRAIRIDPADALRIE